MVWGSNIWSYLGGRGALTCPPVDTGLTLRWQKFIATVLLWWFLSSCTCRIHSLLLAWGTKWLLLLQQAWRSGEGGGLGARGGEVENKGLYPTTFFHRCAQAVPLLHGFPGNLQSELTSILWFSLWGRGHIEGDSNHPVREAGTVFSASCL